MTSAELFAQAIGALLKLNEHCRSGILGVNDHLDVVSHQLFRWELRNVPSYRSLDEASLAHATGIVAFDVIDDNIFISDSLTIDKLNRSCEVRELALIDLMLFGADSWISLRQQNRL